MKKLVCLLVCAGAQVGHALPFSGLYVTGGAGGTTATIQNEQFLGAGLTGSIINLALPSNTNLYADSFSALMEIGYSHQFHNHFVLGGALTANYDNIEVNTNTVGGITPGDSFVGLNGQFKISLSNEFALLFKPGYVWGKNTLFYALLGPRWGNFSSSTHMEFGFPVGPDTVINFFNGDAVQGYQLGVTAGAGIKQALTEHLDIGLEYAYTSYGEINAPNTGSTNDFGGGTIVSQEETHELHAYTNTLMFTLTFRP